MNKSVIVGLTGQTGSGKSTIASIMSELGCKIIDADKIAREVINKNPDCQNMLKQEFGYDIMLNNGDINRKLLAQRAFKNKSRTITLNEITHPYIVKSIKHNIDELKKIGNNIIVLDAALLYESGANLLCDKVIAVVADYEVRLNRIINRDSISFDDAILRIYAQQKEEFYTKNADYVINGEGNIDILSIVVTNLVYKLREAENV